MYIIVGYAFLNTLHLVALQENSKNIEHILTGSLVIGFICYKIASIIPITFGEVIDCIGISLTAIIFAYLIGRFINTRLYLKLCDILRIRESGKKYLWDDIMDNDLPMRVSVYYNNLKYTGFLFNYESYSNSPNVVLVAYMIISNETILEDNSKNKTKIIVLDTEKADKVEIIYEENSTICNEINLFCNRNV